MCQNYQYITEFQPKEVIILQIESIRTTFQCMAEFPIYDRKELQEVKIVESITQTMKIVKIITQTMKRAKKRGK